MRELSPLLWRYRVGLSATVMAFAVTLVLPARLNSGEFSYNSRSRTS